VRYILLLIQIPIKCKFGTCSINVSYEVKFISLFIRMWCLFMKDTYYNKMIHCGLYSGQKTVFYRFSLTKFVGSLDGNKWTYWHIVLNSKKYMLWIYFWENAIDIGGGADSGHYRPPAAVIWAPPFPTDKVILSSTYWRFI
jgi:hypothetical protein